MDGSGNVFVADLVNNAVYEIVAVGGVVSSSSTVNTIGSGFNSHWRSGGRERECLCCRLWQPCGEGDRGGRRRGLVQLDREYDRQRLQPPYWRSSGRERNVLVADSGNNTVKEIVAVGGVVSSSSTVNTIGSGFNIPRVAVDGNGNVFVADLGNSAVKEIVAVGGWSRPPRR